MDAFPQLHVDTSYLLVEGLIEELCARYGPERLLFGTAYPDNCGGGAVAAGEADIGDDARSLIAAGNLERLLRWTKLPRPRIPGARIGRRLSENPPHRTRPPISSKMVAEYITNGTAPLPDHRPARALGTYCRSYCHAQRKADVRTLRAPGRRADRVLVARGPVCDPRQGNRAMQEAVAHNPGVLAAYWLVNPNYPELAAQAAEDFQRTAASSASNSSPITTSTP